MVYTNKNCIESLPSLPNLDSLHCKVPHYNISLVNNFGHLIRQKTDFWDTCLKGSSKLDLQRMLTNHTINITINKRDMIELNANMNNAYMWNQSFLSVWKVSPKGWSGWVSWGPYSGSKRPQLVVMENHLAHASPLIHKVPPIEEVSQITFDDKPPSKSLYLRFAVAYRKYFSFLACALIH